MSVLNQDDHEKNMVYDANAAQEFFKLFGDSASVKADEVIFTQGQKSSFLFLHFEKMYLLTEGSVEIKTASGKIKEIKSGEIFGEHTPFSAHHFTATAKTVCRLMTLSEKQFLTGLQHKPEFVLMLMGLVVNFLRNPISAADAHAEVSALIKQHHGKRDGMLNSKMLKQLVQKLGDAAITAIPPQRVIFKEGGTAMLMYVILEGTVSTRIDNNIVNQSGPGDIVGEIALVDQKTRMASVIAETHTSLLAINRQTLLELVQSMPDFGIALLRVLASRSSLHSSAPAPVDEWDWD